VLKIGSVLVNEELVQLAKYDPSIPQLSVYTSGQMTAFDTHDITEAWSLLSAESGFVLVGKSEGHILLNTDLVELAFITGGGLFAFRIAGRDYTFRDPGDFSFSVLETPAAAAEVEIETSSAQGF
jgi:hypothetical protein